MARDDQLIENLRARTWPGDCEAAAFRIEELLARVAEHEACAKVCEEQERGAGDAMTFYTATGQCAAAIRARNQSAEAGG